MTSTNLRYTAEDGVRVFEMLRDRKTLVEIVLATKIHPRVVKAIHADYDDITGSIHIPRAIVDKLNELGRRRAVQGEFPVQSARALLAVFEGCIARRACSSCHAQPPIKLCADCTADASSSGPP